MKIKTSKGEIDVKPGDIFTSEGKIFGYCADCGRIIRLDGWLKGIHPCSSSE